MNNSVNLHGRPCRRGFGIGLRHGGANSGDVTAFEPFCFEQQMQTASRSASRAT
jgi:hypothetical protein